MEVVLLVNSEQVKVGKPLTAWTFYELSDPATHLDLPSGCHCFPALACFFVSMHLSVKIYCDASEQAAYFFLQIQQ